MSERVSAIKISFDKIISAFEEEIDSLRQEISSLQLELDGVKEELRQLKNSRSAVNEVPSVREVETEGCGSQPDHVEQRLEEPEEIQGELQFGEEEEGSTDNNILFEMMEDEDENDGKERKPLLGELFSTPDSLAGQAERGRYLWMTDIPGEKVDDISEAFSLNDKFQFIRELFDGDEDQFSLTIDRLNRAKTFRQALADCRSAFPEWDENSDIVYDFYMAVRRKFV